MLSVHEGENDPFDIDYEAKATLMNKEIFEKRAWWAFKESMLDDFLENPFAIDAFIPGWMRLLLLQVDLSIPWARVIYALCKVRGEKSISIYFPCDLAGLPRIIDLYQQMPTGEAEEDAWKVRYVLLLWLGQYSKQPFTLSKSLSPEYKVKLDSVIEDIKPLASSSLLAKPACIILARLGIPGISSMHYLNELSKIKVLEPSILQALKPKNPLELGILCKIYGRCGYGLNDLVSHVFHKDSSVRFVAAKWAFHLISQAGNSEEIILNILAFLSSYSSYNGTDLANTFHGGAILLGELFKCSLVSECNLEKCQELICKFLDFEYCKGTFALGANVRDAGCYAVWSLARYRPYSIQAQIYHRLIFMSLFDREVGCRRAAAAAFQELLGRSTSLFKVHFMGLLQVINFTTVNMHPQKALEQLLLGYDEFCRTFLLPQFITKCLLHWDGRKRKQSAMLLPLLERHYGSALRETLGMNEPSEADEYSQIHGFYLGLAYLSQLPEDRDFEQRILGLDKNDVGFELLSESYLTFLAHHPPSKATHIEYIVGCLLCKNAEISELALEALEANLANLPQKMAEDICKTFLPKADKSMDTLGRIGYARALGAIPKSHSNPGPFLRLSLKLAERTGDYLERLTALQAHHRLLQKINDLSIVCGAVEDWEGRIVRLGFDWTRDTRGDVGSFIRIEVLRMLRTCGVRSIEAQALAWRMACERMDKVRQEAIIFLTSFIDFKSSDYNGSNEFFKWLHRSIGDLKLEASCRTQIALGLMSVITGFGKPYEHIQDLLDKVLQVEELISLEMVSLDDFDQKLYKKYKQKEQKESNQ